MPAEPENDVALAAAEDAAFASGFPAPPPEKTKPGAADKPAKVEAETPKPAAPPVEKPDYIQVTRREWDEIKARSASHEGQFSKAFGTIGNLQKLVNGFGERAPNGRKVEIPREAFAEMEKDFPELAHQVRAAMELGMTGMGGTGGGGPTTEGITEQIMATLATQQAKRELETLEDQHPDWRTIVGAVDIQKQQPDPNNGFRQWLGTKSAAYQTRLNNSESAAVISNAIRTFQIETKGGRPAAATNSRDDARAERIREAVQPRGDNAGAASGPSDDEEFMAGFNSR